MVSPIMYLNPFSTLSPKQPWALSIDCMAERMASLLSVPAMSVGNFMTGMYELPENYAIRILNSEALIIEALIPPSVKCTVLKYEFVAENICFGSMLSKNTSAGNRNDGITKLIPDNEISWSSDTEISWQNLTADKNPLESLSSRTFMIGRMVITIFDSILIKVY